MDRELLPQADTRVRPEGAFDLGKEMARLRLIWEQLAEARQIEQQNRGSDSGEGPTESDADQSNADDESTADAK